MLGKIKFFNTAKGYGFITNTEDAKDYFFHVTGLLESVEQDDDVNFDVIDTDEQGAPLSRGAKAINIQKVK